MKDNKREQGMVPVLEVVLAVAVLALVVGAVYVAGHHKGTQAVAKASVSPSPTSKPTSPSASPSQATSASPRLTVKELGIDIPLTSALNDLEYTYTAAASTVPARLHFSASSIIAMPGGSACVPANDPLGIYNVYTSAQSDVGPGDGQAGIFVVKVNSYYIYYHHAQYACGGTASAASKVASLIDPLNTEIQRATPAPAADLKR